MRYSVNKNGEIIRSSQFVSKQSIWFLIAIIGLLLFLYFYSNSYNNKLKNIDYTNTIKEFVAAEDNRDFNSVYKFFSPEIKRFWSFTNPSYQKIKNVYIKSWESTKDSKNKILNIKRINNHTYTYTVRFSYYHVKKRKNYSYINSIKIVFDNRGKIIELNDL